MADLAALKRELLEDGIIDEAEVTRLRDEIYADGTVEADEVQFLVEVRNEAKQLHASFSELFFQVLTDYFLADESIDAAEAKQLRAILFADGTIDAEEREFLKKLKAEAKKTSPEFDALYKECLG